MNQGIEYERIEEFPRAVTIEGYSGSACWILGMEVEADEDTHWSGCMVQTGRLVAVMVGDDHRFACDREDVSPLREDQYCASCGQIGCGHG